MIQFLRTLGFVLIIAGIIICASWFIEPMRALWPWLLELPLAIKIGFGIAGIGLIILFTSLLHERWKEKDADSALRDEMGDLR